LAKDAHSHRQGARGVYASDAGRDRKFGSLLTAGPFPVKDGNSWFFARPHDLQDASLQPALLPIDSFDSIQSSLPDPLEYAVANRLPPSKESSAKAWLSKAAFERYLDGSGPGLENGEALNDSDFTDTEHAIGIAIDPATGTTGQGEAQSKIYSAHYLRLREGWQLGVCAGAEDKSFNQPPHGNDLVKALLNGGRHQIIVGGQQRICSALRVEDPAVPLPRGRRGGFQDKDGKFLVKWILLSPAVWAGIEADPLRNLYPHPGGWLPNWIAAAGMQFEGETVEAGEMLLLDGPGREKARRKGLKFGKRIHAKLVAAIVPKPLVVTGWALPDEAMGEPGGAQSTHLAVPAGAAYYFEAATEKDAINLAITLNWHGTTSGTEIKNRRSTLLGEKGFGLGVCGTWKFYGRD
jgi:hypothetical protein